MQAGIPASMATVAESLERLQSRTSAYILTGRFTAILFAVPFALAGRDYLAGLGSGRARTGAAFLILFTTLGFVWYATVVAAGQVARTDPNDQSTLAGFLTLVGVLSSTMAWAIAAFQAAWGAALFGRRGLEQVAGSAFLISAFATIIVSIMPSTWSYQLGQIMYQLSTLFMVVGVGSLGLLMVRGAASPVKETVAPAQRQMA